MGKASSDEQDKENRRGAWDASEGRWRHDPWAGPFESHEHYQDRLDAYKAGYNNTANQKWQSGGGGCFPSAALVLTVAGWKQISRISPGELVCSYNQKTKEIETSTVLVRKDRR